MAKDDVIDLTDLIQQGSSPQSRGPAPTPPGHVVVPDEKLQMPGLDGVDDLLASLNMTSTPATTEAPPPVANDAPSMDLDTILGFKEPESASAAQPAAGKSFDAVLDEAVAAPAPAAQPAAAEAPAGDLDLDSLLDEPAAAPAPVAAEELDPIAAEAQSVVDEAQQELFSAGATASAPEPVAAEAPAGDLDLGSLLDEPAVAAPAAVNAAAPTLAAQTPSGQKTAPAPVAPEPVPVAADPALAARLAQCESAVNTLSSRLEAVETASSIPVESAADPALADRLTHCETALTALSGRLEAVETAASTPVEPVADPALAARLAACENALAALSGRVDGVEATVSAPAEEDNAALRDGVAECDRALAALSGRVSALEGDARGASDAVLKESLEAARLASEEALRNALENARQDRNELLAALPGLVAEAVRQAVAPQPAAQPAPDAGLPGNLREELDRLGVQCRSMAARLDALEKRLDDLQPAFNANIEKAAAAAMSRLLNEQITRLTQE